MKRYQPIEDPLILSFFGLIHLFPLFQKKHYLCDRDGEVWIFEKRLDNDAYPRYTLQNFSDFLVVNGISYEKIGN